MAGRARLHRGHADGGGAGRAARRARAAGGDRRGGRGGGGGGGGPRAWAGRRRAARGENASAEAGREIARADRVELARGVAVIAGENETLERERDAAREEVSRLDGERRRMEQDDSLSAILQE